MIFVRILIFLSVVLAFLFFSAKSANACVSKENNLTTLEKFEKFDFVIVAKGVSGEKFNSGEKFYRPFPIKSIKMVVEKVFKGNLKIDDEVIILGGNGYDDFEPFREDDIGRSHLLYLCSPKQPPNIFQVSKGMMRWLADKTSEEINYQVNLAADDLQYLEKIGEMRGKSRIYGAIDTNQITYFGNGEIKKFDGLTVRISGNEKTYEVKTDKDGVYEIYDLPEGTYRISPEIPKGWQISSVSSFGSNGEKDLTLNSQVKLKTGKHAFYNFNFDATTMINGKVIDPSGKPMNGVCLDLLPFESKDLNSYVNNDCTDENGEFSIGRMAGGNYMLIANKNNKISSQEPFLTVFYPNVFERGNAKNIRIVEGENQKDIIVQIPSTKEIITLNGTFLSSDGVPVAFGRVHFDTKKADKAIDGKVWAITDKNGKFSIKILKGLKGNLSGFVVLDKNQFKDCPQIIKMFEEKSEINWYREISNTIEIKANENFDNVELKLAISSCNKITIRSEIMID